MQIYISHYVTLFITCKYNICFTSHCAVVLETVKNAKPALARSTKDQSLAAYLFELVASGQPLAIQPTDHERSGSHQAQNSGSLVFMVQSKNMDKNVCCDLIVPFGCRRHPVKTHKQTTKQPPPPPHDLLWFHSNNGFILLIVQCMGTTDVSCEVN